MAILRGVRGVKHRRESIYEKRGNKLLAVCFIYIRVSSRNYFYIHVETDRQMVHVLVAPDALSEALRARCHRRKAKSSTSLLLGKSWPKISLLLLVLGTRVLPSRQDDASSHNSSSASCDMTSTYHDFSSMVFTHHLLTE